MLQDIRFALRTLARQRFVTAMVVLCLALVIGVDTAMFAVFRSYILNPLPYPDVERLVHVVASQRAHGDDEGTRLSPADYADFAAENRAFETLGAVSARAVNLTGDGPPEQLTAQVATANVLGMLGAAPMLGRAFRDEDSIPGAPKVALLDHSLWERRYDSDPSAVGRTVMLDRVPHEIVGVLPEGFEYVFWGADLWLPLELDPAATDRSERTLAHLLGRLRPGVTPDQARADVERVAAELETRHPATHRGYTAIARTLPEWIPGPTDRRLFTIIQVAGLFVLWIACANIANLLLARSQARRREVALRNALGAGRQRILRQLLTESVTLAALGGAAGLGLGVVGIRFLRGTLAGAPVPRYSLPTFDSGTLLYALAITVFAGLLFGLVPALQAARSRVAEDLREGGGRGAVGGRRLAARTFVVAEVALALALLVGAGSLFRSFYEIQYGEQGFRSDGVLTFGLALPADQYPGDAERLGFQERLLDELAATPGIELAAAASVLPRSRDLPVTGVTLEGVEPGDEGSPVAAWIAVSPDYFDALAIPALRGRTFERLDRAEAPLVAVVDSEFVDRYLDGGEVLGERFEILGKKREIVGVVPDVKQQRITGLGAGDATVYLPVAQQPVANVSFLVRTGAGRPERLGDAVRAAVWSLDPELPLDSVLSLDDFVALQLAGIDVLTGVVGGFAGFAMLLAALGVYGLLAYGVSQRTREIGVRMAMGASRRRVLGMVLRQGASLVGVGLLFGVPLAWGVGRVLAGTLGALAAPPPWFLPAIAIGLVVVTAAASLLPARRAAALPPVAALRAE